MAAFVYDAGTDGSVPYEQAGMGALGLVEFGGVRVGNGTFVLAGLGGITDTPDVRQTLNDRSEDHGAFLSGSFYGPRTITIEGFTLTDFLEQLWPALDLLRKAFSLGERQALSTLSVMQPGWAERRTMACRVAGPLVVGGLRGSDARKPYREWQAVLVAPDPRMYGVTLLDPPGDTSILTTGSGNTRSLPNDGNFAAPFRWHVVGPATNPKLIDDARGRSIEYTGVVASGANLIIDSLARTATLSGGNVYKNLTRFDDLSIPPGGASYRALTASGAGGTWRVEHRHTWI